MRQEIKERIEQIKNGEVPKGYKKTKVGIIPQEWEEKTIFDVAIIENNLRKPISEEERKKIVGKYPYFGPTGILDYINEYSIEGKYVLIGEDGDHFLKYKEKRMTLLIEGQFSVNNHAHLFKGNELCKTEYLYYYFMHRSIYSFLTRQGAGRYKLTKEALSLLPIKVPEKTEEQSEIVSILSTWDTAIEKQEKLIELKKEQKKWLMQKLLTGKKRLKGFEGEIKKTKLKGNIIEISEKNRDNKVTRILSVTNSRGFIEQSEQFDRQVASANLSVYKIVRRNQFGYNPSRINVGSIDLLRNFDEGVLSPIYVIFKTDESRILSDYIFQFIKSPNFYGQMKNLLQGSVRDNLSFDALSEMKLYIPSLEEQTAIAKILTTADQEINLLEKELEALKEQKKGLMQLLLTGIVRV